MTTEHLRKRLLAEHRRLVEVRDAAGRLSGGTETSTNEVVALDQRPAEQATETLEREIDEGVAQRASEELSEVDAALSRLDAGTYGICAACGKPIGDERLEVKPAARYCVEDQARIERDATSRLG